MKEIVSEQTVWMVLKSLAVATPTAAVLWRFAARSSFSVHRRSAVAAALAGPAVLSAWLVYDAITDTFGLDSLRGTALNVVLFTAVGAAAALLWLRPGSRRGPDEPPLRR